MECELVAQREQMAARHREQMEEKEKIKRLKVRCSSSLLKKKFEPRVGAVGVSKARILSRPKKSPVLKHSLLKSIFELFYFFIFSAHFI